MPTLSNVTFYMPIDQLVAPKNRFIDQQEQWQRVMSAWVE